MTFTAAISSSRTSRNTCGILRCSLTFNPLRTDKNKNVYFSLVLPNIGKNITLLLGYQASPSCPSDQSIINHLTPNVNYRGRTAPLTSKVAFYIFIHQI